MVSSFRAIKMDSIITPPIRMTIEIFLRLFGERVRADKYLMLNITFLQFFTENLVPILREFRF